MRPKLKSKHYIGIDVLESARKRIAKVFDDFPKIYVSFSGGKDSTVMLHLVADEARARGRKIGLFFVDMEAQYKLTIDFIEQMFEEYQDVIEPFWCAEQIKLRNAVSQFEPRWTCWQDNIEWIRAKSKFTNANVPDGTGMEFEDYVIDFAKWYSNQKLCACFVGIRTAESLNRWRSIAKNKNTFEKYQWTTRVVDGVYNIYPIYDWSTDDIWVYLGKYKKPYNRLYDRMHAAGLSIHQQRICQPYGDDQRKGLWLFQVIEPETWAKILTRVQGANQGALYAQESGNILGQLKIKKPPGHTWESFAKMILETMPPSARNHYENKIAVFLTWYSVRGYADGIPDEGNGCDSKKPSWTRICKALLRNDYWCKGLSFSQHRSGAYEKYIKIMKKRRDKWNIF